jgi:hypothetical protein
MPNDAKLGLVLGIGLVVVIGMVFFRNEPPANGANPPPTTSVSAGQDPSPLESPPLDPLAN